MTFIEPTQSTCAASWGDAVGYEGYVGRWSRQIAPLFIEWLDIRSAPKWLDVACGTGALTSAIVAIASPSEVVACDLSLSYLRHAQSSDAHVAYIAADAQNLPFAARTFHVVVSGLALNFLAADSAMKEQCRVTRHGGRVAGYVWDYAGGYELTRVFWDAAASLDPRAVSYDLGRQSPLCKPHGLLDLFRGHGLEDLEATQIDGVAQFPNFSAYWESLDARQGSLAKYLSIIDEPMRERIRSTLLATLMCGHSDGLELRLRAFAVRGTR